MAAVAAWRRRKLDRSESEEEETTMNELPEIPGATMTGMSAFIKGENTKNQSLLLSSLDNARVATMKSSQTLNEGENAERSKLESTFSSM